MADLTTANAWITDTVTQTNVKVVAGAPTQATAALHQIASRSAGLPLQNAVYSQQTLNQISTTVVSKTVLIVMAVEDKKGI